MTPSVHIEDDHVGVQGVMMPPRDGLLQMIQQIDEKHEEAHRRLRQDLDRLEDQVNQGFEKLREGRQANSARIDNLERNPIDATKLMLRTPVIVTLVIIIIGLAASAWSISAKMDKISDKVEANNAAVLNKMESADKIRELQITTLTAAVNEVKKRQDLKQYDVQEVKDLLMAGRAKNR